MTQIPPALVLGCNTPHGVCVLSDWIEEQTGFVPDFSVTSGSDNFGYAHTDGYGGGDHGFAVNFGDGYGDGDGDGNGYGCGTGYGFAFREGDGFGEGITGHNGDGYGFGLSRY